MPEYLSRSIARRVAVKSLLLVAAMLFFAGRAWSLNPPDPLCTEVLPSGDVALSWEQPNDPGGLFHSYVVYVIDLASGDPVQIAEVFDYNTTTFTHVGADAQNFERTYLLRTRSGNAGQVESEDSYPIRTIFLDVTSGGLNALAFLTWNQPYDELLETSSGIYDVFQEVAPGNWVQVGSALYGQELYVDTIQGLCYDPPANINYRVEITDASGCTSVSSIDGDLLTDGTGPTPPVIETVTVDTLTGEVVICWYPSPQSDTDGYFVQDNTIEDQFITIANIPDPSVTCFTHTVQPQEPKRYLVIAEDECGNDESFGVGHESMYLTTTLLECEQLVDLVWTPYVGWNSGVALYEVYASENGGPFQLAATNSPDDLEVTLPVNPFSEYCFRVKAQSNGSQRASFTNTECLEITYPQTPSFLYLNRVDVRPDDQIVVNLLPDTAAFQMTYRLERKLLAEDESEFEEIGLMQPDPFTGLYRFIDEAVNPHTTRYEYRVSAFDFCQNFFGYSNLSSNMLLNAYSDSNEYLSILKWNAYELWEGGVSNYQIYRSLGDDGGFAPLFGAPGNVTYYEDDVFELIDTHGEFCYYIVAEENFNAFGRSDTVRSNIACSVQEPLLWIPNAFIVGGYNDIFKPVAGYLDFERYQMQIFNRWGKEVFTSNSIDVGWNGYHDGEIAPEGAYIYVITISAGNGQTIEETGSVILLNDFN